MKMPDWKKFLAQHPTRIPELLTSQAAQIFLAKANEKYYSWDELQYRVNNRIFQSKEEAWALTKISRLSDRQFLNFRDKSGLPFSFILTRPNQRDLSQ